MIRKNDRNYLENDQHAADLWSKSASVKSVSDVIRAALLTRARAGGLHVRTDVEHGLKLGDRGPQSVHCFLLCVLLVRL